MISVPRIFEKIYLKINEKVNEDNIVKREVFHWACAVAKKYFLKLDKDKSPNALDILEFKLAYQLVFSKIYTQFGGKISHDKGSVRR